MCTWRAIASAVRRLSPVIIATSSFKAVQRGYGGDFFGPRSDGRLSSLVDASEIGLPFLTHRLIGNSLALASRY